MRMVTYDSPLIERRILAGMILSTPVLAKIAEKWEGRMFDSDFCNLIGSWCIKFLENHGKAPVESIQVRYESWSARHSKHKDLQVVGNFLAGLSEEYGDGSKINAAHLVDEAAAQFDAVRLRRIANEITSELDRGNVTRAQQSLESYNRVQLGMSSLVRPFTDPSVVDRWLSTEKDDIVIQYPGAMGDFFQDSLCRDAFVSFLAPEKAGKSFFLLDAAFRAATQRKRVAYFEAGDMSDNQVGKRLMARYMVRPFRSPDGRWPCTIRYPVTIVVEDNDTYESEVTWETKTFDSLPSKAEVHQAREKVRKSLFRSNDEYLQMSFHHNSTLSVVKIENELMSWKREFNWSPDCVIIDYADILASPNSKMDVRESINENWKRLRSLASKWHCLVLTATQANAKSYSAEILTRGYFSEDKRKFAHVTAQFGLNVTPKEKPKEVLRINSIGAREMDSHWAKVVYVAGCRSVANPCVVSCGMKLKKEKDQ